MLTAQAQAGEVSVLCKGVVDARLERRSIAKRELGELIRQHPDTASLNVEVFYTLADARRKLALWHHDCNHHRPHSALADRIPVEFAALCSGGNDGGETALEKAARFPHSHRTATTETMNRKGTYSGLLLETVT